MAENATKIKTLNGFIEWASQFNKRQYLFRGVSNQDYPTEASAYRRLPEESKSPSQLLNINEELLEKARGLGHNQRNGRQLNDLELLAELQHYNAATCLIDFSRNALVALWFACQKSGGNKDKDDEERDGKVSAIRHDGISVFKEVYTKEAESDIDSFFEQKKGKGGLYYPLYLWQPKQQNNRIIAQHSVFIFGGGIIPIDKECIIQTDDKWEILNDLEKVSNISEGTIYPDFDGFARLNAHNKPWTEPDAEDFMERAFKFYQKDDYDNAIAAYTKVIALKKGYADAYYYRGFLYAEKGKHENAIADYDEVIKLNPKDATAYNNRGVAYYEKGDYDHAIADYDKAIALNPNFAAAYNNRGITYAEKGEHDSAIADYDKAIKHKSDYAEAYNNRGITYMRKEKYDSAIKDYDKAIELNPNFAEAYNSRGSTYHEKGKFDHPIENYNKAIADYDKAIALNPKYANAYNNRGLLYAEKGEYDRAIEDYDKAIALNPNFAAAYNNRGIAYAEKGEYDHAIADYNKAIALNPKYAEAYNNRGNTYMRKEEYDSAIKDYDKAIELNPNGSIYYYNLGIIHLTQENWQQGKVGLMTAKEKGANIVDLFHSEFSDIDAFQKKYNIQLPADIVALLTSE